MILFDQILYWHWIVLAIVLFILEIFSPGVFFMWMGIAAGIVGGLLWLLPDLGWEWQIVIFAVLSIVSVVVGKQWLDKRPRDEGDPTLNRRGSQYIGRVFSLDEAIVNGVGRLRVDDTLWRIQGPDCPAGSRVRVVGLEGTILRIECIGQSDST